MSKDTLKTRYANIVSTTGYNPNPASDNGRKVEIYLEGALPIMLIDDKLVNKMSYINYSGKGNEPITQTLHDPEYLKENGKERFIYIGLTESPQTKDGTRFYYDRLYKDIILIPNIDYINNSVKPTTYFLNGYLIGCLGNDKDVQSVTDTLPITEELHFSLPEPQAVRPIRTDSLWLNSSTKSLGYRSLEIAKVLDDGTQLNTTFIDYYHVLTLGTAQEIFGSETSIPHYLMYQSSPGKYGLKSQGNKTTDQKLRVSIIY